MEEGKRRKRRGNEGMKVTQFLGDPAAPEDPQPPSPPSLLPMAAEAPRGCSGLGSPRKAPVPRGADGFVPPVRARFQPHAVILLFWNETGVASQRGPIRTKGKSCE